MFDKNDLFGAVAPGQQRRAIPGEFSFSGGEIDPETGGAFFYHTRAEDKTVNVPIFGETEGFQQTTTRVITDERRWVGGKGEEEEMGETKMLTDNPLVEFDEFDHDFMNPLFVPDGSAANNKNTVIKLSPTMEESFESVSPLPPRKHSEAESMPDPSHEDMERMMLSGAHNAFPTLNDLDPLSEDESPPVQTAAPVGAGTEYLGIESEIGSSIEDLPGSFAYHAPQQDFAKAHRVQAAAPFAEVHLRRLSERSDSHSRGASKDKTIYDEFRRYLSSNP